MTPILLETVYYFSVYFLAVYLMIGAYHDAK